jgi:hypothetical protein
MSRGNDNEHALLAAIHLRVSVRHWRAGGCRHDYGMAASAKGQSRMSRLLPLAALLIFGFCFGDAIDRACIAGGLLFAASMAGGVPEGMKLRSETDGDIDA